MRESLDEQAAEGVTHQYIRRREVRGFKYGNKFRHHVRHRARCQAPRAPAQSGAIVTHRMRKYRNQRLHGPPTQAASRDTGLKDNGWPRMAALRVDMQVRPLAKLDALARRRI